jgi:phosphoglycolate phosphatase
MTRAARDKVFHGVRVVVFDLDGTLIDSVGDLATAINAMLRNLAPAAPALPLARVRSFVGNGARVLVGRSLAAAGLEMPEEEALPVFLESYRRCLLDTTRAYPGAEEALAQLRSRTLAVLTNKPGDMSRDILAGLGLAKRFAYVYGGGDLPTRKPDPLGLLTILRHTQLDPGEALMVGDSAIDVRTGRAAGVPTVGVSYGFDREGLQAEPPDLLVDDLRELPALLGPADGGT